MKKWVYLQSKHNMYLSPWSILICKSFTEDANKLLVNDGFQEVALSFIDGRITWYGIKNIITRAQFHEYTVQEIRDIDYKTIEKFKASQLDSEQYQDRFSNDVNLKQYHYLESRLYEES